jgi:hypothetical protein
MRNYTKYGDCRVPWEDDPERDETPDERPRDGDIHDQFPIEERGKRR